MLAATCSPVLAPAPGAASLYARYSPSGTHSSSPTRSCLPWLANAAPPPHLQRKVATLHPRLTHRHQATCAPRRSPSVRPDALRRQRRRRARAGCSSRQSTQERCKAGWQEGRGTPVNQSAQGKLPAHSSLTSSRIRETTTEQSHRFESNAKTADSDALHLAAMLHHAGRRVRGRGSGRRGQP